MRNRILWAFALVAAFALAACSGSDSGSSDNGHFIRSIAVTPTGADVAMGQDLQFQATATYDDGSTQDVTGAATWASSVASAAKINNSGLASGLSAFSTVSATQAQTNITATVSGVASPAAVLNVRQSALTALAITTAPANMYPGVTTAEAANATFGTTVDGRNVVTGAAVWTSSSTSCAKVGASTGIVTGVSATGCPATITATYGGMTATTSWNVTTATLDAVKLTDAAGADITSGGVGTPPSFYKGAAFQVKAVGHFSDTNTQPLRGLTWTSSDPTVATVSATGLVTGLKAGTTVVSATIAGVTPTAAGDNSGSTLTMTVVDHGALQSIAITGNAGVAVAANTTNNLVATGTFADTTTFVLTPAVTWASSSPAVTVSATGVASPVSAALGGTVTVSARLGSVFTSATLASAP